MTPGFCFSHGGLRLIEREGVTATTRVKEVEYRDRLMHTYQCFLVRADFALGQRQMNGSGAAVGVGVEREIAMYSLDRF